MFVSKFSFILTILFCPMVIFPMEGYISNESFESSEYCSEDSSGSQEETPPRKSQRKSQICQEHAECLKWEGDQKLLATIIHQNVVSALKTIFEFNFADSLGDPLLEHLHVKITTLMAKEICFPLLPGGIFKIKTTKQLIRKWQARIQTQRLAQVIDFLNPEATGVRVNNQLRNKFADSLTSVVHDLHTLYHLAEKENAAIFSSIEKLIIDSYETIKRIKLKFRKRVEFGF